MTDRKHIPRALPLLSLALPTMVVRTTAQKVAAAGAGAFLFVSRYELFLLMRDFEKQCPAILHRFEMYDLCFQKNCLEARKTHLFRMM